MRATLDMGTYKISNMNPGLLGDDALTVGQSITQMTFDDGLRVLTLIDFNASPVATVTIPSGTGGGGEGTVSSIDIGEGLDGTTDPITTTGDIKLETLNTPITESGGVESITVDKHGRVTQVVGGAWSSSGDPDQDLTKSQSSATSVSLTLSKQGTDADPRLASF